MASIGQELLNVPMGDMIRQMAFAIAEAQVRLDESSITVAEMMGGLRTVHDDETGEVAFDDSRVFFGHEYMTVEEAKNYLIVDDALSGGEVTTALKRIVDAQANVDGGEDGTDDDREIRVPVRISMLELGFTPTFYQFVDTIIEVKIAIKITRSSSYTRSRSDSVTNTDERKSSSYKRPFFGLFKGGTNSAQGKTVSTSQVDASYSSKYSYSAEGASLLRTKLSPVPPPPILEERIQAIMEQERTRREARLEEQRGGPTPTPA